MLANANTHTQKRPVFNHYIGDGGDDGGDDDGDGDAWCDENYSIYKTHLHNFDLFRRVIRLPNHLL